MTNQLDKRIHLLNIGISKEFAQCVFLMPRIEQAKQMVNRQHEYRDRKPFLKALRILKRAYNSSISNMWMLKFALFIVESVKEELQKQRQAKLNEGGYTTIQKLPDSIATLEHMGLPCLVGDVPIPVPSLYFGGDNISENEMSEFKESLFNGMLLMRRFPLPSADKFALVNVQDHSNYGTPDHVEGLKAMHNEYLIEKFNKKPVDGTFPI